jgi:hypothetical protein
VALPACEPASALWTNFAELLRVELSAGRAPCCQGPGQDASPFLLQVTLSVATCAPTTDRVSVVVDDPGSGRASRRDVGLADVAADARPRALALAAAEMVGEIRQPAIAAAEVEIKSPITPTQPMSAARWTKGTGVEGEVRLFPLRRTSLFGGRLSLAAMRPRWQMRVFVGGAAGREAYDVGRVTLRSADAGIVAGPRFTAGRTVLEVGLCAELGWVWIAGETAQTGIRSGAGSGPAAALRARFGFERPISARVRARLGMEAGMAVVGVNTTVDGTAAAGTSGLSLLFLAGFDMGSQDN